MSVSTAARSDERTLHNVACMQAGKWKRAVKHVLSAAHTVPCNPICDSSGWGYSDWSTQLIAAAGCLWVCAHNVCPDHCNVYVWLLTSVCKPYGMWEQVSACIVKGEQSSLLTVKNLCFTLCQGKEVQNERWEKQPVHREMNACQTWGLNGSTTNLDCSCQNQLWLLYNSTCVTSSYY